MNRLFLRSLPFWMLACQFLFSSVAPAFAENALDDIFGMSDASQKVSDSLPLAPNPASLIAENITVITADDIARLNAHTLDEVLQTVPGLQLLQMRTPGNRAILTLSGSVSNNINVLIDGVNLNLSGTDLNAELGMIPVQRIERIEIIKGAASVSWGSSLGGVVNIITKGPNPEKKYSGTLSTSIGEGTTSNLSGGISGKIDRFGYYLDGGGYHSNGLLPDNNVTLNHVFGKLTYDLPRNGRLTFAGDFREGDRSDGDVKSAGVTAITGASRYASTYLRLEYPIRQQLNLELFTSIGQKDASQKIYVLPDSALYLDPRARITSQQASAKLTWGDRSNNIVAGFSYTNEDIRINESLQVRPEYNFSLNIRQYGGYVNGSYSIGRLTLLPGVRLEQVSGFNQVYSYNMGATWLLTEGTLIRAYVAKGFGLAMPNYFNDSIQKIFTSQVGIETSSVPLFWLKGTLFYNQISDMQTLIIPDDYPVSRETAVYSKQINQGFELEGRTVRWHGLSLGAAFNYCDAWDTATHERYSYVPISATKLAVRYDGESGLRGQLLGSFVNWPSDIGNSVHDKQMIWDLFLSQKLPIRGDVTAELFFSGHNLFDNAQYIDDYRRNAPRWFEGGVRVNF